jgi:hypothetical protein
LKGFAMKQKHRIIPRIFITLLGIGLIFMGMSHIMLGFAGKSVSAVITEIRREGGERTDGKPGRYTYNISYTFTLPDGKEVNGFTKQIRDSVYLKADGTVTVRVRYFPFFPFINAMEQEAGLGVGQVILVFTGGLLILLINRKRRDE